ncbi:MAG: hypothetical protein ACTSPI_16710 [Candidatus Heimdallarchaeaceae archaeon]
MPEFEFATTGEYDPNTGKIEYVRLSILQITPAEMHNLCNIVRGWCKNPDKDDPTGINQAVDVIEKTEFPIQRIRRIKKEKEMEDRKTNFNVKPLTVKERKERTRKTKTMHGMMVDGIISYLNENGPSLKDNIKKNLIADKTPRDKEYYAFHAAFGSLHTKEKIIRIHPTEQDSEWMVKEDDSKM